MRPPVDDNRIENNWLWLVSVSTSFMFCISKANVVSFLEFVCEVIKEKFNVYLRTKIKLSKTFSYSHTLEISS